MILSCFQREQPGGQTTVRLLVRSCSYQIHLEKGKLVVESHEMVEKDPGKESHCSALLQDENLRSVVEHQYQHWFLSDKFRDRQIQAVLQKASLHRGTERGGWEKNTKLLLLL